jgi:drug/metabolite transporter (DMT)-like permease
MVCLAVAYNILNTFISKMAADTITITLYGAIAFFGLVGCAIFWSFMSWKFSVLNKIPGPIKE